jgi:hypothetical protein
MGQANKEGGMKGGVKDNIRGRQGRKKAKTGQTQCCHIVQSNVLYCVVAQ